MKATPLLALCMAATSCPGAADVDLADLLAQSQSDQLETRYAAMRELLTSNDPRIPDACLSVLTKEGDSIRRIAARAIGSHWQQIPKERVPVFTAALKKQLSSESDGLCNMARRGIALLTPDYTDAMVSRSPNKRWVIYERHGLPCLIDTHNGSEELLGFGTQASFRPAYGNEEVAPAAIWNPNAEMVAMEIIEDRHQSTIWVWHHQQGLRQFLPQDSLTALGLNPANDLVKDFFSSIMGWQPGGLLFEVSFTVQRGLDFLNCDEKKILWDPASDRFIALPNKNAP